MQHNHIYKPYKIYTKENPTYQILPVGLAFIVPFATELVQVPTTPVPVGPITLVEVDPVQFPV